MLLVFIAFLMISSCNVMIILLQVKEGRIEIMEEYEFELLHETEAAILVFDGDDEYWLPKSQINILAKDATQIVVEVPTWLAVEKGIE